MSLFAKLHFVVAAFLGEIFAATRFNTVRTIEVDREPHVAKRRRWFAPLLIAIGNIYLKLIGAGTRVLTNREWPIHEFEVYRVVYGIEITIDSNGWLLVPERPGTVLANYLESAENSMPQKLVAIRLAVQALSRLHTMNVRGPDGLTRCLSHGDATVQNVIINNSATDAFWFDFDMFHARHMDTDWRHADDLRALISSAAIRFDESEFPDISRAVVSGMQHPCVLSALEKAVTDHPARALSFHLAQANISARNRRQLNAALVMAIRHRRAEINALPTEITTSPAFALFTE